MNTTSLVYLLVLLKCLYNKFKHVTNLINILTIYMLYRWTTEEESFLDCLTVKIISPDVFTFIARGIYFISRVMGIAWI